ncbi:hypothetical protein DKT77_01900 [Meridianimarinicoccus roseus]|jgi:hypothetical protein|uniref:DUF2380 domain-containing protein n=1 Tax=Meridianimarinicoccus roseus TaxID=2072018 RepID=A0A2V2LH49_9RHOB|nr:DUF3280 domain-containing protein [Meridianimarinicoccus roseus]PWR04272.1 hypothetical protein DKT77_01900 [Meridianimarinicoccus roseus]
MSFVPILIIAALVATVAPARAGDRVAFFGITFLDQSLQTATLGRDPAETARIRMIEMMVAERFAAEGFELVNLEPVQADLERTVNPAKCYGCDARMAKALGADYALVGEVQKVSNLILTMNLQLRDAENGETVKGRVVDIRSNTDEAWSRGIRYILKSAFFTEEKK